MPESESGFRNILVCVCEFTNLIKAIPLVDQKAQTIVMALYFSQPYLHKTFSSYFSSLFQKLIFHICLL